MVFGLILAATLILAGTVTALRQRSALRAVGEERFLADEDRLYRRGQAKRRMATSALLVVIGALIGGWYLSGMDARMDAIPERNKGAAPPDGGEPDPQAEADKQFTKFVGFYWIGVMGLVFVAVCLAVLDFWYARKYWMARYKELKADHEAKLQRDLAVYRQQKLNERVPGLKPPGTDDTATDEPPV
jgi:heme A synthase